MARPKTPHPSKATLRKRRQVARRLAEGRGIVLLTPTSETIDRLATLAKINGGSVKSEAEMILRRGALTALQEIRQVADRILPVYRAAKPYLRYVRFLETPDATFRSGDRTLKASDWLPLAAQLGAFYEITQRWGWTRDRAKVFLARLDEAPETALGQPGNGR